MDATTESVSVEREIAIAASPETVWQFLVDPEKATRWMGMTATFDPRPGGIYRVEAEPGPRPLNRAEIWLGGTGPRMMELLGRRADGWIAPVMSDFAAKPAGAHIR